MNFRLWLRAAAAAVMLGAAPGAAQLGDFLGASLDCPYGGSASCDPYDCPYGGSASCDPYDCPYGMDALDPYAHALDHAHALDSYADVLGSDLYSLDECDYYDF